MQVDEIWGRSHLLSPFTSLPAGWTLPHVPGVTLGQIISPLTLEGAIPETCFCILFMQMKTMEGILLWTGLLSLGFLPLPSALHCSQPSGVVIPSSEPLQKVHVWGGFWILSPCWHGVRTSSKGSQHGPQLLGGCSLSPTLGNLHHLLATRVLGRELNKDAHCCWQNNDSLSPFWKQGSRPLDSIRSYPWNQQQ